MRLSGSCLLLGVLAFATGAPAADELAPVLSRIDTASAAFKGLTADVQKVKHTVVLNEDEADSGTIAVKRLKPNDLHVLFIITQPDPKQVEFHDKEGQIYYPKRNEVEIYNVGKSKALVEQFLLLGFGCNSRDLESAYSIKLGGPEMIAGQKTTRIELIPKSQDMMAYFIRVDLWISDTTGLAVQQKLFEKGGDYSLATYSNMKPQPNLPDSAVKMNLPRNAKKTFPLK